jgi:bromodomain-containing protein 8
MSNAGIISIAAHDSRSISQEIEDIRSGKWDSRIRESIETGQSNTPSEIVNTEHDPRSLASDATRSEVPNEGVQPEREADQATTDQAEIFQNPHLADEVRKLNKSSGRKRLESAGPEYHSTQGEATNTEPPDEGGALLRTMSSSPAALDQEDIYDEETKSEEEPDKEAASSSLQETRTLTRNIRGAARRTRAPQAASNRSSTRGGKRALSPEHDEISSEPISTRTREGKRRAPADSADSPRDSKRFREDSEPAAEELAHGSKRRRGAGQPDVKTSAKRFQTVILMLHDQIFRHKNGTIFHNPIKHSEAPDYQDIVKCPMDLKTIKMKVKEGKISNSLDFSRDVYLMFANAMMYNRPGSDVYEMAKSMMQDSEQAIQTYRQTENFHMSQS